MTFGISREKKSYVYWIRLLVLGMGVCRKPATKVLFFSLRRRQLLQQIAALVFRGRFVSHSLSMLHSEALNPPLESPSFGSKLRGQCPQRNVLGKGSRLTQKAVKFEAIKEKQTPRANITHVFQLLRN
jgi:hypothetical protein